MKCKEFVIKDVCLVSIDQVPHHQIGLLIIDQAIQVHDHHTRLALLTLLRVDAKQSLLLLGYLLALLLNLQPEERCCHIIEPLLVTQVLGLAKVSQQHLQLVKVF